MLRKEIIPDKTILKDVNKRLARTGMGSRCRIVATVRGGQVTLTGQMQYENQRRARRAGGQPSRRDQGRHRPDVRDAAQDPVRTAQAQWRGRKSLRLDEGNACRLRETLPACRAAPESAKDACLE